MTAPASARPAAAGDGARKLDSSVIAPFQVAVRGGTVWWTDGFAGTITRLKNGQKKVVVRRARRRGRASRARSSPTPSTPENELQPSGRAPPGQDDAGREPAPLRAHPGTPTATSPTASSATTTSARPTGSRTEDNGVQVPGARYKGIKDSHPYQVEALPNGAWAVAEAAGNEILQVSKRGRISVIALLPRQPLTFTQQMVTAPARPELRRRGTLRLRAGADRRRARPPRQPLGLDAARWPGEPGLGARGAVYKISKRGAVQPDQGRVPRRDQPGGARKARCYVAELFGGKISTLRNGKIVTAASITSAGRGRGDQAQAVRRTAGAARPEPGPTGTGGIYRFPR